MLRPTSLISLLLLTILSSPILAQTTPPAANPAELRTVDWLIKTLERLGEKDLASRFQQDYRAGRVRFGPIVDSAYFGLVKTPVPDATAEVSRGNDGQNTMLIAEQHRSLYINPQRPYGDSSQLISLVSTLTHEYQHMDQPNPVKDPAFEDPAYRAQQRLILTWLMRLDSELDQVGTLPLGQKRTEQLQTISDILRRLRSELSGLAEATGRPDTSGVSPGLPWLWSHVYEVADNLLARTTNLQNARTSPSTAIPKGGAYVLTGSGNRIEIKRSDFNNILEDCASGPYKKVSGAAPGKAFTTFIDVNQTSRPVASGQLSWTFRPPALLVPGQKLTITGATQDSSAAAIDRDTRLNSLSVALFHNNDSGQWVRAELASPYLEGIVHQANKVNWTLKVPAQKTPSQLSVSFRVDHGCVNEYFEYAYTWKAQ